VGGYAARAPQDSLRLRRRFGGVGRLLNFTVRSRFLWRSAKLEAARVRKAIGGFVERRRPPPHIRPKLDLGFRVSGQSVELFEGRPVWRGSPGERQEQPFAKAT